MCVNVLGKRTQEKFRAYLKYINCYDSAKSKQRGPTFVADFFSYVVQFFMVVVLHVESLVYSPGALPCCCPLRMQRVEWVEFEARVGHTLHIPNMKIHENVACASRNIYGRPP